MIYELLRPEFDAVSAKTVRRKGKITTASIRCILGSDLSGPVWVICSCKECQRKKPEIDRTPLPGRNPLDDARVDELIRELVRRRKY
jgi:hypothetical protein